MRTVEEIYNDIHNWELDAGESFLDYFDGDINLPNFVFWAFGKGYLTKEKFNAWEEAMRNHEFISGDDVLFSEEEYAIVKEPEWKFDEPDEFNQAYEKAQRILAEFMVHSTTYQRRVDKFLKEND